MSAGGREGSADQKIQANFTANFDALAVYLRFFYAFIDSYQNKQNKTKSATIVTKNIILFVLFNPL